MIADLSARDNKWRLDAGWIMRDEPVNEARLQHRAAVGDGGNHHGDLQWRYVHFSLADTDAGSVAVAPIIFGHILCRGKMSGRLLPEREVVGVKSFTEMQTPPQLDHMLEDA